MALILAETYREIVSGQRRSLAASLARGLLAAGEPLYGYVIRRKNLQYDRGELAVTRVAAPVISVGNLTVGGTGKTPFVVWLARWFREQGAPVSLLSRGYGRRATAGSANSKHNDEALEIADLLPDVPQRQNPDRVAAAHEELASHGPRVLILDDAFQHRRIARDLDIVLLDALAPFGYGRLLPRGLLREPIESLARAHVVALSRSDAITAEQRAEIKATVHQHAPQAAWLELMHRPATLRDTQGNCEPIEDWRGKRVAAFAGIGNPAGFQHTLKQAGLDVAALKPLADHQAYSANVLRELAGWLQSLGPLGGVLCTHKDLVKVRTAELAGLLLRALQIEMAISTGQGQLEDRLNKLLGKLPAVSTNQ